MGALMPLACHLARALGGVHRAGVIHRDINPANIVLPSSSKPELIDFDMATLARLHTAVAPRTGIQGTLAYMAPEQTGRTGRSVDYRSDLYALGATLYQMATGRLPFTTEDALTLIHDLLLREPKAPCEINGQVPVGLSDIIMRLLKKLPKQRYQSAEGLLHDLNLVSQEIAQGSNGVFKLGSRNFAMLLLAPATLVGRNTELEQLQAALPGAMHTTSPTILIKGAAGVGKSALINALRPAIASAAGRFVSGKFDQHHQDASGSDALSQALSMLGRLLLAQSAEEVALGRRRILESLGRNAGLLVAMWPEFEQLLGAQPPAPQLDFQETELRIQQAVHDLLSAVVTPGHPLVVVLDDLHWAGALSLRNFERLMQPPQIPGLLLVGIYRDESGSGHELGNFLARWRRQAAPPMEIGLSTLALPDMAELIGQMLRLESESALQLSIAVAQLTDGNPFETVEMINNLRAEGELRLTEQGWHWDDAAVKRFALRGNVVDFLAARLAKLPSAARELLQLMRCLGSSVEVRLLAAAAGMDCDQVWEHLRAPLEDGFVLTDPQDGRSAVSLRHDRVQQAIFCLHGNGPAWPDTAGSRTPTCWPAGVFRDQRRAVLCVPASAARKA
jgi:hypothetical protein